ncbi:MAG: hypothetical protein JNM52_09410 [Betaproteobacteria bacterium]|nr:hypothetical protein [Betaproteobacteria bacterium]
MSLIIAFLTALVGGGFVIHLQQAMGLEVGKAVAEAMRKMKLRGADVFPNGDATAALISTSAFDQTPVFKVARPQKIQHLIGEPGEITASGDSAARTLIVTITKVPIYACENLIAALDSTSTTIQVAGITVKPAENSKADLNKVQCDLLKPNDVVATIGGS